MVSQRGRRAVTRYFKCLQSSGDTCCESAGRKNPADNGDAETSPFGPWITQMLVKRKMSGRFGAKSFRIPSTFGNFNTPRCPPPPPPRANDVYVQREQRANSNTGPVEFRRNGLNTLPVEGWGRGGGGREYPKFTFPRPVPGINAAGKRRNPGPSTGDGQQNDSSLIPLARHAAWLLALQITATQKHQTVSTKSQGRRGGGAEKAEMFTLCL